MSSASEEVNDLGNAEVNNGSENSNYRCRNGRKQYGRLFGGNASTEHVQNEENCTDQHEHSKDVEDARENGWLVLGSI